MPSGVAFAHAQYRVDNLVVRIHLCRDLRRAGVVFGARV